MSFTELLNDFMRLRRLLRLLPPGLNPKERPEVTVAIHSGCVD